MGFMRKAIFEVTCIIVFRSLKVDCFGCDYAVESYYIQHEVSILVLLRIPE